MILVMKLVQVLLLVLTVANICTSYTRIVGGSIASKGQFPWQVAVNVTTPNGRHFCGGSIIHSRWVITTARCIQGAQDATIMAGSTRFNDEEAAILSGTRFLLHEKYDPEGKINDVGLILLRTSLDFNTHGIIDKINLPDKDVADGAHVIASGWGTTISNSTISRYLNYVPLKTIAHKACEDIYGTGTIPKEVVCANSDNENVIRGICDNDGGGPLVVNATTKPILVGITSFHSQNGCEYGDPSGFLRIFPYVHWISEVVNFAMH